MFPDEIQGADDMEFNTMNEEETKEEDMPNADEIATLERQYTGAADQ